PARSVRAFAPVRRPGCPSSRAAGEPPARPAGAVTAARAAAAVVPDGVGWWWRWTSPGLLLNWSALGVRPPLRLVSRTAVPVPYGPSTTRHSRGHDRGTAGRSRVARRNIDRR